MLKSEIMVHTAEFYVDYPVAVSWAAEKGCEITEKAHAGYSGGVRRIVFNTRYVFADEDEEFVTLAHEIQHLVLGHAGPDGWMPQHETVMSKAEITLRRLHGQTTAYIEGERLLRVEKFRNEVIPAMEANVCAWAATLWQDVKAAYELFDLATKRGVIDEFLGKGESHEG